MLLILWVWPLFSAAYSMLGLEVGKMLGKPQMELPLTVAALRSANMVAPQLDLQLLATTSGSAIGLRGCMVLVHQNGNRTPTEHMDYTCRTQKNLPEGETLGGAEFLNTQLTSNSIALDDGSLCRARQRQKPTTTPPTKSLNQFPSTHKLQTTSPQRNNQPMTNPSPRIPKPEHTGNDIMVGEEREGIIDEEGTKEAKFLNMKSGNENPNLKLKSPRQLSMAHKAAHY
ncbi:hypothetical protein V8G54_032430 [Vigna mungo]|uniref:Uncharacterized protein n=1 Tax=Vigna mungo TaxID=3915 RepID=A0AAQ3RHV1_VIGMU